MKVRRIIAATALVLGAITLVSQAPADLAAQDAKAKAKKQKFAEKKAAEVKKPVADPDAKPAPAVINPPAAPAHPMPTVALAQLIDRHLDQALTAGQVRPSPQTSDAEFLRRAYLDIAGVIPTAEQAVVFLDDKSPDKRARLIDKLLESPHFGRRMADVWTTLMYPIDSDN